MKKNVLFLFCALLSGLLAGFSFPVLWGDFEWMRGGWLAWIAFVPILLISKKFNFSKKTFFLGGLAGLVFYSISLSWFYPTLPRIEALPLWAGTLGVAWVIIALSAILGAHLAITHILERKIRWGRPIIFPVVGVTIAFILNYFPFGGFPWGNFAYTQWQWISLIQIMDIVGVYGLLFLILLVNKLAADFLGLIIDKRFRSSLMPALTIVLLLSLSSLYGILRMESVKTAAESLDSKKVALIQANISQEEKFKKESRKDIFRKYRQMTYESEARQADLVVWPETASPVHLPRKWDYLPGWFGQRRVPLIFGTFSYASSESKTYWNTAFLANADNRIVGKYDKVHRVPFAEYVPFPWHFIIKEPVTGGEPLQKGEQLKMLKTKDMNVGVLICFEDIFPELARSFAKRGADFLVLVTNDAWHGWSSAPFQHLLFSIYRAIENRIFVVRAANTGISAVIDPAGNIKNQTSIFTETTIIQKVGLGSFSSVYTRFGDWFAWLCPLSLGGIIFKGLI